MLYKDRKILYLLSVKIYLILIVMLITSCCSQEKADSASTLLNSNSAKDRNNAAMQLARCGSKASKAVPRLIELLYDSNIGVQSSSAYALRKIDTPEARMALDKATKRKN